MINEQEMQAKAERMARECAEQIVALIARLGSLAPQHEWSLADAINEVADIVKVETTLPAILTAEAELSHIDAVLARRPALADEPDRCAKIEKAINVAKQVDSLRTELESTNMALKASCQCAEQFKKERDELKHPRIYSRCPACLNDTLILNKGKLLCTWFECKNPTVMDWVGQPEWQKLFAESVNKEMDRLRAELAKLRRNVGTLYEWIQGNTSLTGKQKEAANFLFEQLDKGVKDNKKERCEHCGSDRIYHGPPVCPGCGAPNCCQTCCKVATLEKELATAKAELETEQMLVKGLEGNIKACEDENAALRDVAKACGESPKYFELLQENEDKSNDLKKQRDDYGYNFFAGMRNGVIARQFANNEALRTLAEKGVVLDAKSLAAKEGK